MRTPNVIFLYLFSICTVMNAQTTGWNNIGGNWKKNGYVDVAGPTTDSVLWETVSPGIFGAPMYIEGDRLVTMRFQSTTYAPVQCYDLQSGKLLWSVDVTKNSGRSLPVGLRDNRVYVIRYTESQNDSLIALDVEDGSRIWTSNVNVAAYISESGVFDSTGYFYIYGQFKTFKIDPVNGKMIWQVATVPIASGSGEMAIDQETGTGYTLGQSGGIPYLWATDLATGKKKYSIVVPELQPGGNYPQSPLMVGNEGTVYVQLTEDQVAAIKDDGSKFTMLWQTPIQGNCAFSTMCLGSDGSIYAPSNGRIIRLDPKTGSRIDSTASLKQGGFYSPRLSATNNGIVYATNGENGVYAFDLSLKMVWSDPMNFTNTSGVCLASNGLAAVSGGNKIRVYTPALQTGTSEKHPVSVRIYPNPATSFVHVDGVAALDGRAYRLMDAEGRVIRTGSLFGATQIPLDGLPRGLYHLGIDGIDRPFGIVKQ